MKHLNKMQRQGVEDARSIVLKASEGSSDPISEGVVTYLASFAYELMNSASFLMCLGTPEKLHERAKDSMIKDCAKSIHNGASSAVETQKKEGIYVTE